MRLLRDYETNGCDGNAIYVQRDGNSRGKNCAASATTGHSNTSDQKNDGVQMSRTKTTTTTTTDRYESAAQNEIADVQADTGKSSNNNNNNTPLHVYNTISLLHENVIWSDNKANIT